MTEPTRRALTIDDPVAGRDACHVAHPALPDALDGRARWIPLSDIYPNPEQPRKQFDEAALAGLADSIRERGVLQPIIVRPRPAGGFEIVAGERRWRAAQKAGQPTIPALIDASLDGADSLEFALIENVVREDLTPIEEARTIALLLDDLKITATLLAKRLGRSRADVAHTVRLLDLPDQAIELIDSGALTKGHGKALLTEPDHHRRRVLASRAADAGWSVRTLEAEIARAMRQRLPASKPHADHEAAAARLQDTITRAVGSDVTARPHRDGYQVMLDQVLRTTGDFLKDWAAIMRTLQARDVIRTDNNPVGDIAEAVIHAHFGGERGGFSQKGWDVTTPDGTRLQVKGLKITSRGNPSRNLSPISGIDYDVVVVVIFDEEFRVTEALWVPREVIEKLFPNPTPKGLRMGVTQALRAHPLVKTVDLSDAYGKLHA